MQPLLLCLLIQLMDRVTSDQSLNGKDYKIIQRFVKNCANDSTSMYLCLAGRAATAIERYAGNDIELFDGIVLRNARNVTERSGDERAETPDFKRTLSRLLDSHYVRLDLTRESSRKLRAGGGGGNRLRISRRERKYFWYTMMVLLGIFGLTGPIIMKALTLIAGKALIASKIALLMVGSVALKKIFANDNGSKGGVQVHTHTIPIYDEHDDGYDKGYY